MQIRHPKEIAAGWHFFRIVKIKVWQTTNGRRIPRMKHKLSFFHTQVFKLNGVTRHTQQETGQGLVEYLILVALIGVSTIAIVSLVGQNLREQYANISAAIRNKQSVSLTAPEASSYGSRNMDDFTEGSRSQRSGRGGMSSFWRKGP